MLHLQTKGLEEHREVDVEGEVKAHQLQPFLLPKSPENADLYVRKMAGEFAYGECLSVFGRAHLSFNTYFNSFYESYWVRDTAVDNVSLTITGHGVFWCNIFRETKALGCTLIVRVLVRITADEPTINIPIRLVSKGFGHSGRLFADLETEHAAEIQRMAWTTSSAPKRNVQLGVGICTFNREPFVLRTVAQLLDAPTEAAVHRIVVVNQGAQLQSPDFRRLLAKSGEILSVVDQRNFGGAGGFTRSAMELLQDEVLTHILFMDDDIELEARHLITTAAFLRYSNTDIVVGGHMLDLFRKNILYEAGNSIARDNTLRPNHHNLDLNLISSLTALSRPTEEHFNGWWFAAIPVSCFREHGLPTPVFIRGDDLEYGVRLHRAGVSTVALPPVSVWHEPFYAKAPGWQLYYDLRNRLIFASSHEELCHLDSPTRLLKLLMVHLIRYDYQTAWFMMQSLTDFMKGPSLLDEGLPEIHERVTRSAAQYAPIKIKSVANLDEIDATVPLQPWPIRRRMMSSMVRLAAGFVRQKPNGVIFTDNPIHWARLGPSYVLADRDHHFFLGYTYSFSETWRHLRSTGGAIYRYARGRRSVADAWKLAHANLTSDEAWRATLGLGLVDAAPASDSVASSTPVEEACAA